MIENISKKELLIVIIKRLFENSSKNLSENDRRLFQIDYKQEYNLLLIKKDAMTKDYMNDIIIILCKNIKFDISPSHEIHF